MFLVAWRNASLGDYNISMRRLSGLYVITEPALRDPIETAHQVLMAGVRLLQLRDKTATTRELVRVGQELRALTRQYGARLIVNDRLDVALAIEADGVHLGQDDLPVLLARRIAGERLLIGVSAETVAEAMEAESAGADYLGVGPMFATSPSLTQARPLVPNASAPSSRRFTSLCSASAESHWRTRLPCWKRAQTASASCRRLSARLTPPPPRVSSSA